MTVSRKSRAALADSIPLPGNRMGWFQKNSLQPNAVSRVPKWCMVLATVAGTFLFPSNAHAVILNWSHTQDSINDGHSRPGVVGANSPFEIYSSSYAQDDNLLYFVFTGNTPLEGVPDSRAADGNIGWSDLFLNFTGKNFNDANSDLYGIRFAANNDSAVSGTGIWNSVTTTSVAAENDGFSSINTLKAKVESLGGTFGYGGLPANTSYFDPNGSPGNVIGLGTKVGDLTMLDAATLLNLGWNADQLSATGQHTIGFGVSKALLPTGDFVGSASLDCLNDIFAFSGTNAEAVPEPTTIAGLALAGTGVILRKLKQRSTKA